MYDIYLLQLETGKGQLYTETNEGFFSTLEMAKQGAEILTDESIDWQEIVHESRWSACLCEQSPDCPTLKIRKVTVDKDLKLERAYFIWGHEDLVEERLRYPKISPTIREVPRTPSQPSTLIVVERTAGATPPTTPAPVPTPVVVAEPERIRVPVEIGGSRLSPA